jgi:hypothetical protein
MRNALRTFRTPHASLLTGARPGAQYDRVQSPSSAMGLFRAYRKFGGRLALLALALQFYLSFAHIHPDDIYGPVGRALSAAEAINLPAAESLKPIPPGEPWYSGDALCPVCETIYFLSISATPDAPAVLPLTFSSRPTEHSAVVAALFVAPRRAPFQSRAPPTA